MFKPILFALLAAASAMALSGPHVARDAHGHQALAARFASAQGRSVHNGTAPFKSKRFDSKRCRARTTSSSSTEAPTSTFSPPAETSTPPPEPTTTQETTTQWLPDPTTWFTPDPSPSPTDNGGSGGGSGGGDGGFMSGTNHGQATFYTPGLGACGRTNGEGDLIAAASHLLFDIYPGFDGVNPNNNPLCGRQATITRNGQSITVTIVDRCEACAIADLDLTITGFQMIAQESEGRVPMDWHWA